MSITLNLAILFFCIFIVSACQCNPGSLMMDLRTNMTEFEITKWRKMLGSIFDRDNFSWRFRTCWFFGFLSIALCTDQFFYNDDTYYWVYLSSDYPFQGYYKVRQFVLLQGATAFITKCDRYYKVRQNTCYCHHYTSFLMLLLNKLLFKDRNKFLHGRAVVWLGLGTGSHQFFKPWMSYLLNLLRQLSTICIWSLTYRHF